MFLGSQVDVYTTMPNLTSEPKAESLSADFSAARRGTVQCNFTATRQAGWERFFCLFQIKFFIQRNLFTLRHYLFIPFKIQESFSYLPRNVLPIARRYYENIQRTRCEYPVNIFKTSCECLFDNLL